MSVKIEKYDRHKSKQLSRNFKLSEMNCKGKGCCKETAVSYELIERLQLMRDKCQKSIIINSGYRCESHNKKVGGTSKSRHIYGMAADLRLPKGMSVDELAALAQSVGFRGVLKYPNFIHVDVRETKPYYAVTTDGSNFKSVEGFNASLVVNPGVKPESTVRKGSSNLVGVIWIQFQLQKAGFEVGNIDGLFGSKTYLAVKNFQAARGLKVDGICGTGETVPALALIE